MLQRNLPLQRRQKCCPVVTPRNSGNTKRLTGRKQIPGLGFPSRTGSHGCEHENRRDDRCPDKSAAHWDHLVMLFSALFASGQINMRKIDGWQTFGTEPIDQSIDLAT
jgi:hypothetical protein